MRVDVVGWSLIYTGGPLLQPLPLPITPFIAAFRVGFSSCPAMPLSSISILLCYYYYHLLLLLSMLLFIVDALSPGQGQQALSTQWRHFLRLQTCFEPGSEVHKTPEPRALPSIELPTSHE